MVICEPYKFIFVHVFRTGGSSIDRAFGQWALPANQTHKKLEDVPNWETYFSFGFVRNPWDRTLSGFKYQQAKGNISCSFEEHVKSLQPNAKTYAQYNMLKNCSFVGRFEHLQEDLKTACDIVRVPVPDLPHVWKTEHQHYTEYYTPEMIDVVRAHQWGDIQHYGFAFDSTATTNVGDLR